MRTFDLHAKPVAEIGSAARVIDVAVRQQNFLDGNSRFFDSAFDAIEIPARIDDGADLRRVIPNQRAILLERRHADDRCLERG